jgi:hypothetical protein
VPRVLKTQGAYNGEQTLWVSRGKKFTKGNLGRLSFIGAEDTTLAAQALGMDWNLAATARGGLAPTDGPVGRANGKKQRISTNSRH